MSKSHAPDRRRHNLGRLALLAGFIVGACCASILMALASDECANLTRSLTLLPSGLRCSGPKDDFRVPWGTDGPGALPVVLAGGLIGALLVALVVAVFSRGSDQPA